MTVTSRRSATGALVGVGGSVAAESAVPHSAQNFAVASTGAPHAGQAFANAVPHSLQNLAPANASV
jgi:hypothetical protein